MATIFKSSFSSGELSPLMAARVDQDVYQSGCKTLLNAIPLVHGGVTRRPGFQFINSAKTVGNAKDKVVLIPFVYSTGQAYILEFGDKYVRVFKDGDRLSGVEVTSPYDNDQIASLRTVQSADRLFIFHPDFAPYTLDRYSESEWVLSVFPLRPMPFLKQNTGNIRLQASAHTGDAIELTAANQVENGDFASAALPPWTDKSTGAGTAAAGTGALVLTPGGAYAAAEQEIAVEPGYTYRLKATVATNDVEVAVGTFSGDDSLLSTSFTAGGVDEDDFEVSGNITSVFIRFHYSGAGTSSVDDVECAPRYWDSNVVGESANKITGDNSDFETSIGDWWPVAIWPDYVQHNAVNKTMEIRKEKLAGPGHQECVTFLEITNVTAGLRYKLSFEISNIAATMRVYAYVGNSGWPFAGYNDLANEYFTTNGTKTVYFTIPSSYDLTNPSNFAITFGYATTGATGVGLYTVEIDNVSLVQLGQTDEGGGTTQYSLSYVTAGVSGSVSAGAANVFSSAITVLAGPVEYTVSGNFSANVQLQRSTNNGSTWDWVIQNLGAGSGTIDEPDDGVQYRIGIPTGGYTSGTAYASVKQTQYYPSGYVEIYAWVDDFTVLAKVLKRIPSLDATYLWSEGAWSNLNGFPALGCFFENRLMLAATETQPNTIWGSKTDEYDDFGVSDDVVDSDAVSFSLLSREMNEIRWMDATERLRIGTSRGEWWMSGASGNEPLTPSSVLAKQESWVGAANVDSERANQQILFIRRDRKRLYSTQYQYDVDRYVPVDISLLAEHLFNDSGIKEVAYQQYPHNLVWVLLQDGSLVSLTLNQQHQVIGWARHELGSDDTATIESIAVIPGDEQDELWAAVYEKKSSTVPSIERLTKFFEGDTTQDAVFFDHAIVVNGWNTDPTKTLTLTGGTTWLADEIGLTLTAVGHEPFKVITYSGMSVSYPQFAIRDDDGNVVNLRIGGVISSTVLSVQIKNNVPTSLRGVAVSDWAKLYQFANDDRLTRSDEIIGVLGGFHSSERINTTLTTSDPYATENCKMCWNGVGTFGKAYSRTTLYSRIRYIEFYCDQPGANTGLERVGIRVGSYFNTKNFGGWSYEYAFADDGLIYNNNVGVAFTDPWPAQCIIGIAWDQFSGKGWFSVNGVYPNNGDPETGANPHFTKTAANVAGAGFGAQTARTVGNGGISVYSFASQQVYPHPKGFAPWWNEYSAGTINQQIETTISGEYKGLYNVNRAKDIQFLTGVSVATAGWPYTTTIQPMNIGGPEQQGKSKRINQVIVRLHQSLGVQIGETEALLIDIPDISTISFDGGAPVVYSGDYAIDFNGSFQTDGNIIIQIEEPYPLTVLGMNTELEYGDR